MSSPLIQRILMHILTDLIASDRLVLIEGASVVHLASSLAESLSGVPGFAQFGTWLASSLISSDQVDDFYVTDADLSAMLREVEP